MKKLYIFSLLLLTFSYISQAQIVMFSDTSNKWKVTGYNNAPANAYTKNIFYTGDTMINGKQYQILQEDASTKYLIYETDWGWGQVYARQLGGSDTLDHLLYDYTLNVNDTFRTQFNGKPSTAVVTSRNITYFVGYEYLTWNLKFVSGGSFPLEYVVIQGIGALTDPMYPLLAADYTKNVSALSCFTHNNAQPFVSPSVPYDAITSYMLKSRFDNDSSCMYNSLSVPAVSNNNTAQTVQLLPNPLNSNTRFVFTPAIQTGEVVITNSIGQTVIKKAVQNEKEFLIGNQISNPGIYFYRISDYRTGRTFSGEFIY